MHVPQQRKIVSLPLDVLHRLCGRRLTPRSNLLLHYVLAGLHLSHRKAHLGEATHEGVRDALRFLLVESLQPAVVFRLTGRLGHLAQKHSTRLVVDLKRHRSPYCYVGLSQPVSAFMPQAKAPPPSIAPMYEPAPGASACC